MPLSELLKDFQQVVRDQTTTHWIVSGNKLSDIQSLIISFFSMAHELSITYTYTGRVSLYTKKNCIRPH